MAPTPKTKRLPGPGKITLTVDQIAITRGLGGSGQFKGKANLRALKRGTGLAYATLYYILRQPHKVQYLTNETLVRLCAFLDCQPGDLMHFSPVAPDLPQLDVMSNFQPLEEFDGNF